MLDAFRYTRTNGDSVEGVPVTVSEWQCVVRNAAGKPRFGFTFYVSGVESDEQMLREYVEAQIVKYEAKGAS